VCGQQSDRDHNRAHQADGQAAQPAATLVAVLVGVGFGLAGKASRSNAGLPAIGHCALMAARPA